MCGVVNPSVRARLLASVVDLAVIWSWLGTLTAASYLVRSRIPEPSGGGQPDRRLPLPAVDAAVFAATVLPSGLYFALTEGGRRHASLGKRWMGLTVVAARGGSLTPSQVVRRTAVKLLPWQLAHLMVARQILKVDTSYAVRVCYVLSLIIPAGSVILALSDKEQRALHDHFAATRVVARSASARR